MIVQLVNLAKVRLYPFLLKEVELSIVLRSFIVMSGISIMLFFMHNTNIS
jgi:hypothetical protein